MKSLWIRMRYWALATAAGGLFLFSGCGLSDQQLTSVWQSVLTAGLNTLVSNALSGTITGAGA
jgi:hypothetical protein